MTDVDLILGFRQGEALERVSHEISIRGVQKGIWEHFGSDEDYAQVHRWDDEISANPAIFVLQNFSHRFSQKEMRNHD